MTELLHQILMYPSVDHDDVVDALSIAMTMLVNPYLELADEGVDLLVGESGFEPSYLCP